VVDDRHSEEVRGPVVGVRVEPLPGQEEIAEPREIEATMQDALGIFPLDRSKRRGSREESPDPVVRDDPPEGSCVRRPYGLSLVEHRRGSCYQRRVDDVRVPDGPTQVGCGPEDVTWIGIVDVLKAPPHGDRMTTVVTDDALGMGGRARGVQHVERIGRHQGNAVRRVRVGHQVVPLDVEPRVHLGSGLWTLQDDAPFRSVGSDGEGLVEEGLVFDDTVRLDAAGARYHDLGLDVVDADSQLSRRNHRRRPTACVASIAPPPPGTGT
jgi:hypothetical protein